MKIMVWVFLISTVFLSSGKAEILTDDNYPVVETSYGPVRGLKFVSSWTNKTIYSFRGIPYAAPPIGELRFRPPVAPANWTSVMDCTADKLKCPQPYSDSISEDCLYVNVYSPFVGKDHNLVPVIVWVHGGAFYAGSGRYEDYGPDFLVAENIVFVSLNYRLGALGFLSLGTVDVPGNAGLRDQLLALRWVQSEVSRFGGDPRQVTLFGESAGAASVHLQYISPLPVGLFCRVIGDSGAGMAGWAVRPDGRPYALQLASLLNCSVNEAETCLRAADMRSIIDAQNQMKATSKDILLGSQLEFVPTIDKNCSDNPFLPNNPIALANQGVGSRVPFLMGINSQEGLLKLLSKPSGIDDVKDIRGKLEEFIPDKVRNASSQEKIKQYTSKLRAHYFTNPVPSLENDLNGYLELYSDYLFGIPTAASASYFRTRSKVYLYYFSFDGAFKEKLVKYYEAKYNITGVMHGEELHYIFIRGNVNQTSSMDSDEMKTFRRMVRMWTNFAIHGSPTVGQDPLLQNVTWYPVGNSTSHFLVIDCNLTMSLTDFLAESVALWDSVSSSQPPCRVEHVTSMIFLAAIVWLYIVI